MWPKVNKNNIYKFRNCLCRKQKTKNTNIHLPENILSLRLRLGVGADLVLLKLAVFNAVFKSLKDSINPKHFIWRYGSSSPTMRRLLSLSTPTKAVCGQGMFTSMLSVIILFSAKGDIHNMTFYKFYTNALLYYFASHFTPISCKNYISKKNKH